MENCLGQHSAVREVAVIGHKDEQDLIKPQAFVVLRDGYSPSEELARELQNWVLERMAKYKYPRWVEFVPELPKSTTGKIQRFKLR